MSDGLPRAMREITFASRTFATHHSARISLMSSVLLTRRDIETASRMSTVSLWQSPLSSTESDAMGSPVNSFNFVVPYDFQRPASFFASGRVLDASGSAFLDGCFRQSGAGAPRLRHCVDQRLAARPVGVREADPCDVLAHRFASHLESGGALDQRAFLDGDLLRLPVIGPLGNHDGVHSDFTGELGSSAAPKKVSLEVDSDVHATMLAQGSYKC